MEKIKVNMSPNPLDVQTIHASQNDGEARQWGFELHNNGEKIDSSSISDQLVFKAYEGGTEEILPTNGSTPTTSPFKGDIKYPQGLLTDQEFTYRESPTESDGLAKITDIKGNTLVWNQLVQNGNFADTSLWRTYASTGFSVSNNVGSFTVTGATGAIYQTNTPAYVSGHKYLVIADFYVSQQTNISVEVSGTRGQAVSVNANTWYRYSDIVTPSAQGNFSLTCGQASVQVKNVMCFDITKMGLDISSPSDFTSLFPLPYYAYNQGTLLSFNGNGIKTVGKNLINARSTYTENGITFTNDNGDISISGTATRNAFFTTTIGLRNGSYFIGAFNDEINNNVHVAVQTKSGAYALDGIMSVENRVFSLNNDINNFIIWVNSGTTLNNFVLKPMISFESPEYFEPYTSSTLSLPISTYFPTGMKSAGTVYDELTPNKAITRIGSITLNGSETDWGATSGWKVGCYVLNNAFENAEAVPGYQTIANLKNSYGLDINTPANLSSASNTLLGIGQGGDNGKALYISLGSTYDAADKLKNYLASNNLTIYYELATPTETPITTASLVTENAEIPLSNEDGVLLGKCTEQLSENPGFIDAKIKLSDADGECYSNKIQLHVERSPQ